MNCLIRTALFSFLYVMFFFSECCAFSCKISTTPVNFGNYDVFTGAVQESTGTITVDCKNPEQKPLSVIISIDKGSSEGFNPRQMTSTMGDRLNYYLYTNPARTTIWGDGTGGSATVNDTLTKSAILNVVIYGRIPAGQNVSVGTYTDVLTATVIW
ncbi:MAG: spore coat U domain-containing protein [Geobacteraceae bacterium]